MDGNKIGDNIALNTDVVKKKAPNSIFQGKQWNGKETTIRQHPQKHFSLKEHNLTANGHNTAWDPMCQPLLREETSTCSYLTQKFSVKDIQQD